MQSAVQCVMVAVTENSHSECILLNKIKIRRYFLLILSPDNLNKSNCILQIYFYFKIQWMMSLTFHSNRNMRIPYSTFGDVCAGVWEVIIDGCYTLRIENKLMLVWQQERKSKINEACLSRFEKMKSKIWWKVRLMKSIRTCKN